MPFNTTTGVYTPPSGATTAAPSDVIRSSTWNDIFTDISNSLTLLGEQLYKTTALANGDTPYVPLAADSFLLVSSSVAFTVDLPLASSRNGLPLVIKDISGNAHTNNITINRNSTDTIEGATSIVINTDWGGWHLYPVTGGWVIRP